MRFVPLASSSAGNAYLLIGKHTTLLLECGITYAEMQRRLYGRLPRRIDGCLVTHEHGDHARGARQIMKRGIPLYMSEGTAVGHKDEMDMARLVRAGERFTVGEFTILPFTCYHNTEEPLGWLISEPETGEKFLFAIDTANLNFIAEGITGIAIEANFSEEIMRRHPARDPGMAFRMERTRRCHMEINRVVEYLRKLDLSRCRCVWLMHLSDTFGDERRFQKAIRDNFGLPCEVCPK